MVMPEVHEMHTDATPGGWTRPTWIDYSALDAKVGGMKCGMRLCMSSWRTKLLSAPPISQATWQLREALYRALKKWPWCVDPHLSKVLAIDPKYERRHDGRNVFKQ